MTKLAWSLIRAETKPSLELELRLGIETLWALPLPGTQWNGALLPSNVLVCSDGSVTIGAAHVDESSASQRFLPPEVRDGAGWSLLSAIYSVGALLFEASTGQAFETQRTLRAELSKRRTAAQGAQGAAGNDWLVPLLETLAKATDEAPRARWQTPEAFCRELARVAAHRIATRDELGAFIEQAAGDLEKQLRQGCATLRGTTIDLSRYPEATPESRSRTRPMALAAGQRYQGASLAVVILVAVLVVAPTITRTSAPARETPNAQESSSPLPGLPLIQGSSPEAARDVSSSSEGPANSGAAEAERRDGPDACPGCDRPMVVPVVEPAAACTEHSATISRPAPSPKRQRAPKRGETFDYGI